MYFETLFSQALGNANPSFLELNVTYVVAFSSFNGGRMGAK